MNFYLSRLGNIKLKVASFIIKQTSDLFYDQITYAL